MPKYLPIEGKFKLHGILVRRFGSRSVYLLGSYPGIGQKLLSCYTADQKEALKIARELECELFKADPSYVPTTFEEVAREVIEINESEWGYRTGINAKCIIEKRLIPEFGELPIANFREIHWKKYVDRFYKKYPNEKLFNTRKYMGKILKFARRKGWIHQEFDLPIRDTPQRAGKVLTDEEVARIGAYDLWYVYDYRRLSFLLQVCLGRYMGMRMCEVLSIKRSEIDLNEDVIRLSLPDTRTKKHEGELAIAPEVMPVLLHYLAEHPGGEFLFPARGVEGYVKRLHCTWNRARTAAGLPDVNFHDLRHTFATDKIHVHKKHLPDVAAYLRNKSAIGKYSHPTVEHTRHVVSGAK